MSNCPHLAAYVDDKDQDLLQKLVSINVEQDEQDPRSATVTFEFGDNEYLKSNTLVKKFTVKADAAPLGSDEGEWVEDVTPHKTEIEWTSDEKNLAKQLPLSKPGEEDFQPGSFFSSFFDAIDEQVTVSGAAASTRTSAHTPCRTRSATPWSTRSSPTPSASTPATLSASRSECAVCVCQRCAADRLCQLRGHGRLRLGGRGRRGGRRGDRPRGGGEAPDEEGQEQEVSGSRSTERHFSLSLRFRLASLRTSHPYICRS
jgi:hypothetical protein